MGEERERVEEERVGEEEEREWKKNERESGRRKCDSVCEEGVSDGCVCERKE